MKDILRDNITEARELSCDVIRNLSKDIDNQNVFCASSNIALLALLVRIIREGKQEAKIRASSAIENISTSISNIDVLVANDLGLVKTLVNVLIEDNKNMSLISRVSGILRNLCVSHRVQRMLCSSRNKEVRGVVSTLVGVMRDALDEDVCDVLDNISNIALQLSHLPDQGVFLSSPSLGLMHVLIEVLSRRQTGCGEVVCSALLNMTDLTEHESVLMVSIDPLKVPLSVEDRITTLKIQLTESQRQLLHGFSSKLLNALVKSIGEAVGVQGSVVVYRCKLLALFVMFCDHTECFDRALLPGGGSEVEDVLLMWLWSSDRRNNNVVNFESEVSAAIALWSCSLVRNKHVHMSSNKCKLVTYLGMCLNDTSIDLGVVHRILFTVWNLVYLGDKHIANNLCTPPEQIANNMCKPTAHRSHNANNLCTPPSELLLLLMTSTRREELRLGVLNLSSAILFSMTFRCDDEVARYLMSRKVGMIQCLFDVIRRSDGEGEVIILV